MSILYVYTIFLFVPVFFSVNADFLALHFLDRDSTDSNILMHLYFCHFLMSFVFYRIIWPSNQDFWVLEITHHSQKWYYSKGDKPFLSTSLAQSYPFLYQSHHLENVITKSIAVVVIYRKIKISYQSMIE